jgi:hypothetical protein
MNPRSGPCALVSVASERRRKASLSRWQRIAAYSFLVAAVVLAGQQAPGAILLQTVNHTMSLVAPAQDVYPHSTGVYWFTTNDNTQTNVSLALAQWGMAAGDVTWGEELVGDAAGGGLVGVVAPLALIGNATPGLAVAEQIAYRSGAISPDEVFLPKSQYQGDSDGDVYIGLRFQLAGGDHYGWARVSFQNDPAYGVDAGGVTPLFFTVTIDRFAYEDVAGKPIRAGTATSLLPGDADANGAVNGADLNTVLSNYNRSGMDWARGDFTGDGLVNGSDLNAALSSYNQSVQFNIDEGAVPEPCTFGIWAIGVAGALAWQVWRKRRS